MKETRRLKSYLYHREKKRCFYCQKRLKYQQMSIDHVYPKSRGGTDDVFNLVTSCKECNDAKADKIPKEVVPLWIALFKRAVIDRRISGSLPEGVLEEVDHARFEGDHLVFETPRYRIALVNNRVVALHQWSRKDRG